MKKLLLIAIVSLFFITCSNNSIPKEQYDAKINEIEQLKIQIGKLKSEIDELKYGAARELIIAKNAFEKKSWDVAIIHAQNILDSHPEAPEAKDAAIIVNQAKEAKKIMQVDAERELAKIMANMVKKQDKMRGITFWRDPAMPGYVNSKSWVGAYIVESGKNSATLRFAVYYVASDWLFIEKYLFNIDGKRFVLTPSKYGDDSISTDNSGGEIWEWWDVTAEGERLNILKTLSEAKEATIRYEGKNYYRDRVIGPTERNAIKNTLKAYKVLIKR